MTIALVVDEDVFAALQAQAEPLVDDANSVLRRLLGLQGISPDSPSTFIADSEGKVSSQPGAKGRRKKKTRASSSRAARGTLLPEAEYELPLLRALQERGDAAPASHAIERVGELLSSSLMHGDKELLESGLVRWRSRTQFVRLRLTQRGDMKLTRLGVSGTI